MQVSMPVHCYLAFGEQDAAQQSSPNLKATAPPTACWVGPTLVRVRGPAYAMDDVWQLLQVSRRLPGVLAARWSCSPLNTGGPQEQWHLPAVLLHVISPGTLNLPSIEQLRSSTLVELAG